MPTFSADGVDIYYEIHGSGPPLMLIAGLGSSSDSWKPVLPLLTDSFTCVVFDNRGTGRSSLGEGRLTIEQMAADTTKLIEHLDLGIVSAVGWSMGGMILQSLLIKSSPLIRRAVLLSTLPHSSPLNAAWREAAISLRLAGVDAATISANLMPSVFTPKFLANHEVAWRIAEMERNNPRPTSTETFIAQSEAIADFDSRAELKSIACPTLVLTGAEDVMTPLSHALTLGRLIADSTVEILPRGGHAMIIEYPHDTLRVIKKFLKRSN